MSYDGHLGFGLLGDYDALPELEAIADDLKWAIACAAAAPPALGARRARRGKPAKPPRTASARSAPRSARIAAPQLRTAPGCAGAQRRPRPARLPGRAAHARRG